MSDIKIVSNFANITAHLAAKENRYLGEIIDVRTSWQYKMKMKQRFRSVSLELVELVAPKPMKMVIDGLRRILRLPLLLSSNTGNFRRRINGTWRKNIQKSKV
jgi:hypothetical protein